MEWLLLWAAAWLLLLWLTSNSPPVDNAEQLTWVRSLEWGYYKHPPLPTALLWPLVQVFGVHEWVTYVAAALLTCGALLLARKLVADLCGRDFANIALLGTLCIGYYNNRLAYYNHDTVLLLCVTAAAYSCWRAFADRSLSDWIAVGFAIGLGALAKYQVALVAGSVFTYWVVRNGWRDPLHRRGLLWATVVSLVVFSPHAYWVISHDFLPLQYALSNSMVGHLSVTQCSADALRWVGDQISQLSPALLLGAGLLLRTRRRSASSTTGQGEEHADANLRSFLFCWGMLPLLAMPSIAVLFGAKLHMNWGAAFMPFTCAALMHSAGRRVWSRVRWRDAFVGFVLVQALLAVVVWSTSAGSTPVFNQHRSSDFSSQLVADTIGPPARQALGGSIRVIAGRQRLVSTLSLRLIERPLVLIEGRYELSPWLREDMGARCGILWVGGPNEWPPAGAQRHDLQEGLWWAVQAPSGVPGDCH